MPLKKRTYISPKPDDPRSIESLNTGFRKSWPVASAYEVVNGILIAKTSDSRDSYPVDHRYKSIPIQLAKIQEGDEAGLLSFTRKYGMLGLSKLLPTYPEVLIARRFNTERDLEDVTLPPEIPNDRKALWIREVIRDERERFYRCCNEIALTDSKMQQAWLLSGGGDLLYWIWAHIRTLRLCCDLTLIIQDENEMDESDIVYLNESVASYLRKFQPPHLRGSKHLTLELTLAFLHQTKKILWSQPETWTALQFAKHLRRDLINRNIGEIRLAIEADGKAERSFFQYHALIEIAYWHLHNLVINGRMKRCKREHCGEFFIQSHRGTEYCPEPKTPKGESRCAVLDRTIRAKPKYLRRLKRKRQKR